MPKFEVDIPHALPLDEVKARLDRSTGKIESKYGAACKWTNDRQLSVSRKGFDATVTIEAARVHVEMNLGFLLVPVANAIKTGLARELTTLLTDGAPGGAPGGPSSA